MAVLMTYHKLVERDSKHIDYCWKCTTICILVLTIICCLTGSLSLQKLILVYEDHCILGAELEFRKNLTNTTSTSVAFSESKSYTLSEYFSPVVASRLGPLNEQTYPEEELFFMKNDIIDDKLTKWGKHSTCDFAIFIPIFQFCFGTIITVMFIICGKGGKAEQGSFLPQPWRIVTPSLIFFLAMTCISIANLTSIHKGLNEFCSGFVMHAPDVGCLVLMNNFALNENVTVLPSVLYIILITFSWILLVCWIVLLSIMIARIIFVVDFQLVRVTVKTCEYENVKDGAKYKIVEPQDDDKIGKDAVQQC